MSYAPKFSLKRLPKPEKPINEIIAGIIWLIIIIYHFYHWSTHPTTPGWGDGYNGDEEIQTYYG